MKELKDYLIGFNLKDPIDTNQKRQTRLVKQVSSFDEAISKIKQFNNCEEGSFENLEL